MIPGRVSIVIPHYNQSQYLPDAIKSCIDQTYEDIEIIVVDDGSTQDISRTVSLYESPWINFYFKPNGGLSSARNYGISHASGEYILPLDSDDKIRPRFVEKAVNANSDIVSCWCQYFGTQTTLFKPDPTYSHANFLKRNRINCCSLFRKSMWAKVGGYDEQMKKGFEDWDFWIRSTALGYRVVVLQEALFLYRKHGKSMIDGAIKTKPEILRYMQTKYKMLINE